MKRIILAVMFLFFFSSFLSLHAQWAKVYGGEGSEEGNSIQQTVDGGYIVAGSASSFGAGGSDFGDIWVIKLSSEGDIEWQKTYGGIEEDGASSIQLTMDGGYIVAGWTNSFGAGGGYYGDIWVIKLTSEGDIEWQKTYGGIEEDGASSIQPTIEGGYIVAGWTNSFGPGEDDFCEIWILKLSSEGDIEWQKTYGRIERRSTTSIQPTIEGGYIVADSTFYSSAWDSELWILKLSSEGNIEWQKNYGSGSANSIQLTIDGGYIVAGWTNYFGAEYNDICVLKLSSDGDIEWQRFYGGGILDDSARSIQPTIDGGYIVAGSTSSFGVGPDCWILKLSSVGDIEWQKSYGGNHSPDSASSIQQTNDEGYIVAGGTGSWGAGSEMWILKLLQNGDINSGCAFIRSTNAEVSDINIIPADSNMVPEDTNISPQNTDISPQDSDANVYTLCVSDICTLSLSVRGPGTTDPKPDTYTYFTGTRVSIEAIPDSECAFSGWIGNVVYGVNLITITMDGDKQITADFYKYGPGGGEGIMSSLGVCFIATAAYGSSLHPHLNILRDFRDRYLMPSKLGHKLVMLYYKYSPFFADLIVKYKVLKVVVRISLIPLVAFSYSMVHFGPIITAVMLVLILMVPTFLVSFFRRKMSQVEAKSPKALASQ